MEVLGEHIPFLEAFNAANDVLHNAVSGISEIINSPGLVNVDFADVKTVMGEMGMAVPSNSLPMIGGRGPHDYITMGGMFTMIKVREELPADGSDPGWYQPPPGTMATNASGEELRRDGIVAE